MPIYGGTPLVLAASAPRSASGTGDTVVVEGWRRAMIINPILASATDAGDTLDVYVDVSPDGGVTWVNAVHFTQQAGNGAARTQIAVLDTSNPGTSVVTVTSDAAAAAVRPSVFGNALRARWVVADANANASHTFAVTAYVW